MQAIADDAQWKLPATIDDPAVLDEITHSLKSVGYARRA
jgi:propionyl-CoA synthetase